MQPDPTGVSVVHQTFELITWGVGLTCAFAGVVMYVVKGEVAKALHLELSEFRAAFSHDIAEHSQRITKAEGRLESHEEKLEEHEQELLRLRNRQHELANIQQRRMGD